MKAFSAILLLWTFFIILSFHWISPESAPKLSRVQKQELIRFAREIGSRRIQYAESWIPIGETEAWIMDCSNTVRYIYKTVFRLALPRTSKDQYDLAVKRGVFHPVNPEERSGRVDPHQLVRKLRTGDILFWIDTYSVQSDPPVSHVMIYLGKNASGRMKMFGAGTFGRGEQTTSGGLDVYEFDPNRKMGCVKNSKGACIRESRFIGYARFLD